MPRVTSGWRTRFTPCSHGEQPRGNPMLFSSFPFFLFFALYFICEKLVPARQRLLLIILASTVFYGYWNPWYVVTPYALVALAYFSTHWMARASDPGARRRRLAVGVTA